MKTTITFTILLSLINLLIGQDLKDKQLLVEKTFDSELYTADPGIKFDNLVQRTSTFNILFDSLKYISEYTPGGAFAIKPVSYEHPVSKNSNRGYALLSKGNLNRLTAHAGYTLQLDNYFDVSLNLKHADWEENSTENKFIKENSGSVSARYYITKDLLASLQFNIDQSRYGLFAASYIPEDHAVYRDIRNTGITWSISSFKEPSENLNFSASIGFNRAGIDNYGESFFQVKTLSSYGLNTHSSLQIEFPIEYSSNSLYDPQNVIAPSINYHGRYAKMSLLLGARLNLTDEKNSFFPRVSLAYHLNDNLSFTAETDQQIIINNFSRLGSILPYLNIETLNQNPNTSERRMGIGAKAALTKQLKTETTVNYRIIQNGLNILHINDNTGTLASDLIDFNHLELQSSFSYKLRDSDLSIGLSGTYNYFHNQSDILYNMPIWHVRPSVNYHMFQNRLTLNVAGLVSANTRQAMTPHLITDSGTRKNIVFSMEFSAKETLKFFVTADNLLNDRYTLWHNYAVFGRSITLGGKAGF